MKYAKQIEEFKTRIIEGYKNTDSKKPKRGSKDVCIMIWGRENEQAMVQLRYSEQFYRMFGQHNFVDVIIFEGSLKEACQVARELKAECGLKISYLEYTESVLY